MTSGLVVTRALTLPRLLIDSALCADLRIFARTWYSQQGGNKANDDKDHGERGVLEIGENRAEKKGGGSECNEESTPRIKPGLVRPGKQRFTSAKDQQGNETRQIDGDKQNRADGYEGVERAAEDQDKAGGGAKKKGYSGSSALVDGSDVTRQHPVACHGVQDARLV